MNPQPPSSLSEVMALRSREEPAAPGQIKIASAIKHPDGSTEITFFPGDIDKVISIQTLDSISNAKGEIAKLVAALKVGEKLEFAAEEPVAQIMISKLNEPSATSPSSFWLSAMLPLDLAEELIENMEELYVHKWSKRHSAFFAKSIWYVQVFRLVAWRFSWPISALLVGVWKIIKIKFG